MNKWLTISIIFFHLSCTSFKNSIVPATNKEVRKNVFGAYASIYNDGNQQYEGELIARKGDSVVIRTENEIFDLSLKEVDSVILTIRENKADRYAVRAGLMTAPAFIGAVSSQDYSGSFLAIGAATLFLGLAAALIENGVEPYELTFTTLDNYQYLAEYSRFPGGLPAGVDYENMR